MSRTGLRWLGWRSFTLRLRHDTFHDRTLGRLLLGDIRPRTHACSPAGRDECVPSLSARAAAQHGRLLVPRGPPDDAAESIGLRRQDGHRPLPVPRLLKRLPDQAGPQGARTRSGSQPGLRWVEHQAGTAFEGDADRRSHSGRGGHAHSGRSAASWQGSTKPSRRPIVTHDQFVPNEDRSAGALAQRRPAGAPHHERGTDDRDHRQGERQAGCPQRQLPGVDPGL